MILQLLQLLALLVLTPVALFFWHKKTKLPPTYPPTPPVRLPLLGHLQYLIVPLVKSRFCVASALDRVFAEHSRDGVLALHFGPVVRLVTLGTHDLVREHFRREDLNHRLARPQHFRLQKSLRGSITGKEGIALSSGEKWQELRRFVQSSLRDFGFGKVRKGEMLKEEAKMLVEAVELAASGMDGGKGVVRAQDLLADAVVNVLWRMVAGERLEYGDPKLAELVTRVREVSKSTFPMPSFLGITLFPFLRRLFPKMDNVHRNRVLAMRDLLSEEVDRHRKDFEPTNQRDFIDAFIAEIKNSGEDDDESAFHESEGYEQLVQTLIDLFIAGTEPTTSVLSFALLYMVREPEVQDRVRAEIHDVLGTSRFPESSDRQDLPFTEATIMEIQRMANVTPRGLLPHANMGGPVKIGPYTVPEAHTVQASFGILNMSASEGWVEPERFDPERFIDGDSGKVSRSHKLIPFSTGKRQCPAETLATSQVFLFFAALMQRFKFEPAEEEGQEQPAMPSLEAASGGVTRSPRPFGVKVTRTDNHRAMLNNNNTLKAKED